MGQWRREEGMIVGRIGYERAGDLAELWDADRNDFAERRLPEGLTSPFALDPEKLEVVFQLRAGRIRPTSFTKAFQALLNEAGGSRNWRVEHLISGEPFESWVQRVRRVRRLEVRLERPNPDYHGRDRVEELIEGANAQLLKLILETDDPNGLNLTDELVIEAIDHAAEHGSVKALGDEVVEQRTRETQWRSDVEGSPVQAKVEVDPQTREARPDELRRALTQSEAAGDVERAEGVGDDDGGDGDDGQRA
jgi:hypothetical protein